MKRRQFVGTLLAGAAVLTGQREEWLIVADTVPNLKGRCYSAETLLIMVASAKGLPVAACDVCDVDHVPLNQLRGICEGARVEAGQLQCRFRWFGAPPLGLVVAPAGSGILSPTPAGHHNVEEYRLTSFALHERSSFESATAVSQ